MGIIVNKRENLSELQQKITAELREKQKSQSSRENFADSAEFSAPEKNEFDVEKSEYLKNYAKSRVPGWIWILGLICAAVIAFLIVYFWF